ncbi:MAG: ABC transporter permease [Lachnospiraceae bacterium]|nr:ABC transporter permease [Lachnospiraceae bacterium]
MYKVRIKKPNRRQIVQIAVVAACLLLWLVLQLVRTHTIRSVGDIRGAERFAPEGGYAQIGCYFADTAGASIDRYSEFSFLIDQALTQNAIEAKEPDARLFVDCYTVEGAVTISRAGKNAEATAIGTGGDFFFLHPLELVSGQYYSPDALTEDQILIDEHLAWQLFGGNDVAGLSVNIGGKPHIVRGVVRRAEGRLREKAGAFEALVWLPAESLRENGMLRAGNESMTCYEVVMPDPVRDFAVTQVREAFRMEEGQAEIIDHTTRFSNFRLLDVLREYDIRSMMNQAIRYPYWENIARSREDFLALVMVLQALFLAIPIVLLTVKIVCAYRNKTWRAAEVFSGIGDCIYGMRVKRKKT